LSRLIDLRTNGWHGLTEATPTVLHQLIEAASREDTLKTKAADANPLDKFQLVFGRVLESLFIERMEQERGHFCPLHERAEFQRNRGLSGSGRRSIPG